MQTPLADDSPRGNEKEDGPSGVAIAKNPPRRILDIFLGARRRLDWWCAAALLICGLSIFGDGSRLLGFYGDDAGFMKTFQEMSLSQTIWWAAHYDVPGRNLHVIWQYLIFLITGGPSLGAMPAEHWLQALFTSGNAVLLFFLLRKLSLPVTPSLVGAWLFLLGPTHGQVHFWMSALPMNLISTFFVLCLGLSGLATARAAARGEKARAARFFALDGLLFLAGAFTYDQAVPVLCVIALSTALAAFWLCRRLALTAILFAALVCSVPLIIIAWKSHALNNGPSFTAINAAHIVKVFHESLDVTWGSALRGILFDQTLPFSTRKIREKALRFSVLILCLGAVCVWRDLRAPTVASRPSLKRLLFLLLGAVLFFLLAYFPAYLWYFSPRHNYLPSVAVASIAGILAAALLSALRGTFGKAFAAVLGLALVCGISAVTYFLAQSILVDKESWIVTYQARKHLHDDLSHDQKFLSALLFVFESLPVTSPFGTAILGNQQDNESLLLTNGATQIGLFRPFSIPTPTGAFIYVELDQWGRNAFVHIPERKVFRTCYESIDRRTMRFTLATTIPAPALVTVEPVEGANIEPGSETAPRLARIGPETLELTIPPIPHLASRVVAAVPLVGDHPGAEPLTSATPDGHRYMQIVELPVTDERHPRRFILRFDASLPEVKGVSLFVVGASARHSLGEVFLAP